jgi:putative membrane protein
MISLAPLVTILAVALIFLNGWRKRGLRDRGFVLRSTAFLVGLCVLALALEPPLTAVTPSLFYAHQGQFFLLRFASPMLLLASRPFPTLIAGLPRPLRKRVGRLLSKDSMRAALSALSQPVSATVLFIGAIALWEVPAFHDAALNGATLHGAMHASFLVTGILFWFRVFDTRPDPKGAPYGHRLMMLWLVMLSSIALGSYTTLKQAVLYPAYGVDARLFETTPLGDEQVGGLIIWVASALAALLAVIITIHAMGLDEERLERRRTAWTGSNWAAMLYPSTGEALIAQARKKNVFMAGSFALFAAVMFLSAILVGVTGLSMNRSNTAGSIATESLDWPSSAGHSASVPDPATDPRTDED